LVESLGQRRAFNKLEDERDDVFAFFERKWRCAGIQRGEIAPRA
jgi:hypothetical protein